MIAAADIAMQKGSRRKWLVPLLVCMVMLLVFLLPLWPALKLSAQGRTVLVLPIRREETFSIRYTHSVNRSPVVDTIAFTGSTLTVRSSLFQAYGAGIPSEADGIGKSTVLTEDGLLLSGIDRQQPNIRLITGAYADHYLLYRDKQLQLKAIVGEHQQILLAPGRASCLDLIIHAAP